MNIDNYCSDNEQRAIISKNLNYLIVLSGKEQKQIATELDVNPPTFNQWVKGKAIPSLSMLKRIAEYFNITLSDLVDQVPQESNVPDSSAKLLAITRNCNDEQLKLIIDFAALVTKHNYLCKKE